MSILVFDTETSGLPPRGVSPKFELAWDRCRLVQIAWELYDDAGKLQQAASYMVKPQGFTIPDEAIAIHGISNEEATASGEDINTIFAALSALLPYVKVIVAHNIEFDRNVLASEMHRMRSFDLFQRWMAKDTFCTMLKGAEPKKRWPKLADLYAKLFGKLPDARLHRADTDARVCAAIYFKLLEVEKQP